MLALGIAAAAIAQPQGDRKDFRGAKPDFEKIKAEKVAFITSEVGLTSKEAEAFWPIYNKVEEEQHALMKAEREAYKALSDAIAEGKDTGALLDAYLKAKEANTNLHIRAAKDYKKVLSAEKVAKFYVCEEKFLRKQLGRLGGGHRGHGGMNAGGRHGDRSFNGGHGFHHRDGRPMGDWAPRINKAEDKEQVQAQKNA